MAPPAMTEDQTIRMVLLPIGTFFVLAAYERIKTISRSWGGALGFWRKLGYVCGNRLISRDE